MKKQLCPTAVAFIKTSLILTTASVVLFSAGCGKKAPPVAPRPKTPAVMGRVNAEKQGEQVVLTWTLETPDSTRSIDGFIVQRSKIPRDVEPCGGCSEVFEPVATVPVDHRASDNRHQPYTYTEQLTPGYRYLYKVIPHVRGAAVGSPSMPVLVVH